MKTQLALSVAPVAALGTFAAPTQASLIGTPFTATVTHTGIAGGLVGPAIVNHTYGGLPTFFNNPLFGSFLTVTPAAAPGFDNAILVDFSLFNYSGFAGETGTISITGLAENVASGSVRIFPGTVGAGLNVASNVSSAAGTLTASWATNAVFTPSPTAPDAMVVAWNSSPVPAPGAMALLCAAGVVGHRRRRRA